MTRRQKAAAAYGVSWPMIRRREAEDLSGVVSDETRGSLIPVDDLLATRFRLNAPVGPDTPPRIRRPGPAETTRSSSTAQTTPARCAPSRSGYGPSTPWRWPGPSTGGASRKRRPGI
ncbi:hypothetical protein ABE83_00300 [Streptomyces sp. CFMR 7]|nr:hypothetical protein ABE83_00300 [Streptomyces sp. CFMR 7]